MFIRQPYAGVDGALDEFRIAAKLRFIHYKLDGRDEHADVEPHQLAESSDADTVKQQRFLPAQNTVKKQARRPAITRVACNVEWCKKANSIINNW